MSAPRLPTVADVHEYSTLQRMQCCGCVSIEKGRRRIAWTLMILGGLGLLSAIGSIFRGGDQVGLQLILSGVTLLSGLFTFKGYKRSNMKLLRRGYRCMACLGITHIVLALALFVSGVAVAGFDFDCDEDSSRHRNDDDFEWCEHRMELGAGLVIGSIFVFLFGKLIMHFKTVSRAAYRKNMLERQGVHTVANSAVQSAVVAAAPLLAPSQQSVTQGVELVSRASPAVPAVRVAPASTPAMRCSVCRNEVQGTPGAVVNCNHCGSLVNLGNAAVMPSPVGVVVGAQSPNLGAGQSYVTLGDGDVKTV